MRETATVTDIQRSSLHDGPGVRTTVFFKGCPLRCVWCHNPECISPEPQTLFYPEKCVNCGQCRNGCYTGARVLCGREMTAAAIMNEILLDTPYYQENGGVTFSGGEPFLQADFLCGLADQCHAAGIHVACETSMFLWHENLLRHMDLIFCDIKLWDSEQHRRFTGVPNEGILDHIRRASGLGIPMVVRTPIVPGINDTPETVSAIAGFLRTLPNIQKYELLPYHPLGTVKQKALGLEPTPFPIPTKEKMKELNRYADLF